MVSVRILTFFKIIDFPVPPYNDRLRTGGNTIREYYESGITTYMPIATIAKHYGIRFDKSTKILDFGCGVGRQLLHFSRNLPETTYYACDVSESAISFIKKNYPMVQSYKNNFTPPLQYESDFFDLIYSVSIFSHLSNEKQMDWLTELARITKGYCVITTEGFNSLSIMSKQRPEIWGEISEETLEKRGWIYREYNDFLREKAQENLMTSGSKFVGIENSYGNMLISPSYIRETWPKYGFEVVSLIEGIIGNRQDMVLLRKVKKL